MILLLSIVGKQLDGIWHTSIVIFGREYFYGGGGIESCQPVSRIAMTRRDTFEQYAALRSLSIVRFVQVWTNLHFCGGMNGKIRGYIINNHINQRVWLNTKHGLPSC